MESEERELFQAYVYMYTVRTNRKGGKELGDAFFLKGRWREGDGKECRCCRREGCAASSFLVRGKVFQKRRRRKQCPCLSREKKEGKEP